MLHTGRYLYVIYMCHLAVKKLLKALVAETQAELPPKMTTDAFAKKYHAVMIRRAKWFALTSIGCSTGYYFLLILSGPFDPGINIATLTVVALLGFLVALLGILCSYSALVGQRYCREIGERRSAGSVYFFLSIVSMGFNLYQLALLTLGALYETFGPH